MRLNAEAKIQIHVGGVYNEREESVQRFVRRYKSLDPGVRKRLVMENDDRLYNLEQCLRISTDTGIPVLFDVFHHSLYSSGHEIEEALSLAGATWKKRDGLPMADYSSQKPGGKRGQHAEHMNVRHFRRFLKESGRSDFDVMLEIKDKEASALKAVRAASKDTRFVGTLPKAGR
jgi:UV DNA damage endonuclease